jgi:carboxypeptidase C (cathepsin A)
MKKVVCIVAMLAFCALGYVSPAAAQQPEHHEKAAQKQKKPAEVPKEVKVVTEHSIRIGGQTIPYKATAGSILIKNDKGEPTALIYYWAYTKDNVSNLSQRPVAFLYNGGPGSSCVWLHMGAYGPRRVVTANAAPTGGAPYKLVDNQYSLLNKTDLVFIDPVGTGFSHAVGKAHNWDFWGVDSDVHSLARFIVNYVTQNDRWNSPKFLIGESYGTFRSVALGDYLQSQDNMYLNGIVLMSSVLDLGTISFPPGEDLPYVLYLPSYAATAWYHKELNPRPANLPAFIKQVTHYAETTYADALLQGAAISPTEKEAVAKQLSQYTGLSVKYLMAADLRVNLPQFMAELQRERGMVTGRLDARFSGYTFDPLAEYARYDPQSTSISGAFVAAFHSYISQELKFHPKRPYMVSANFAGHRWKWAHAERGGYGFPGSPNVEADLKSALITNPHLYVQVENGYYDLATPFFGTEYTMDHLGLPAKLQGHIDLKYYDAGHMMYVHVPSLEKLSANVDAFIAAHSQPEM